MEFGEIEEFKAEFGGEFGIDNKSKFAIDFKAISFLFLFFGQSKWFRQVWAHHQTKLQQFGAVESQLTDFELHNIFYKISFVWFFGQKERL